MYTVEAVLIDHPMDHTNVIFQDRCFLVTGSITLKYRTFYQEYLVFQDRWSVMAVVSQDSFHCIHNLFKSNMGHYKHIFTLR